MMLALVMSVFLIAFVGFATDYTNFWFQRQSIQSATDATCQAAAVDLLLYAASFPSNGNFTPGSTGVNCGSTTNVAPCLISQYNGYNAASSDVTVNMSFPTTVSGVTGAQGVTWPFVQVDITKQTPAYFSALLTGHRTRPVHATATCGLTYQLGSGYLLVLRPYPQITTFTLGTGTTLKLVGGSPVGLQVNADSIHATSFGSGSRADLSLGDSSNTGSDFAVTGTQSDPGTTTYTRGTTGEWLSPDLPTLNPYSGMGTPSKPSNGTSASQQHDGCPITKSPYCTEYSAGYYSAGISVASGTFALFKPGIYYMDGDLTIASGAYARMSTGYSGYDTHYGAFFYFHSGKPNITATNNTYTGMSSSTLTCNGSAPAGNYNIPNALTGVVLFAPCTTNGTWTSANGGDGDTSGTTRGILFYMDPSNTSTNPSITGSSTTVSALVGTEVLHNSSYGVTLTITGAATDGIYTWGNIVTDIFTMTGAYQSDVLLNSTNSSPGNKVAMLE